MPIYGERTFYFIINWTHNLNLSGQSILVRSDIVAQTVKNPPAMWEIWVPTLGWEEPLEEGMATHLYSFFFEKHLTFNEFPSMWLQATWTQAPPTSLIFSALLLKNFAFTMTG